MPTIRALRRSRGMTFSELAITSGVSARTLAEIEYGLATMDGLTRHRLATIFGLAPHSLRATAVVARPTTRDPQQLVALGLAVLAGTLTLAPILPRQPLLGDALQEMSASLGGFGNVAAPASLAVPAATLTATIPAIATPSPTATLTPSPTRTPTPAPTPTPAFTMTTEGPRGCPIIAANSQRIVITQPYGVGSHAPGPIWGGVDLALDSDNDGNPEPDTTRSASVVATHSGVAQVFPNSWPGGNFIIITHAESGFATGYGHLDVIAIMDDQVIDAGTQIGTVGTTGVSSGPHLHYEVRAPGGNIDPAPLIGCGE